MQTCPFYRPGSLEPAARAITGSQGSRGRRSGSRRRPEQRTSHRASPQWCSRPGPGHGVAPEVVEKALPADHAGHYGARAPGALRSALSQPRGDGRRSPLSIETTKRRWPKRPQKTWDPSPIPPTHSAQSKARLSESRQSHQKPCLRHPLPFRPRGKRRRPSLLLRRYVAGRSWPHQGLPAAPPDSRRLRSRIWSRSRLPPCR